LTLMRCLPNISYNCTNVQQFPLLYSIPVLMSCMHLNSPHSKASCMHGTLKLKYRKIAPKKKKDEDE
jgi:hypothetical protein